jgi:hypothetical protein
MKKILFTILALAPSLTFGTNQIREKIIYNGNTNTLFTLPLSDELKHKALFKSDPVTGKWSTTHFRISTACKRGYVGKWEFTNDTLYLVQLQDGVERKDIPASQLIKDSKYPIKADWFTGELRIGTGRSHSIFYSTEIFIPIENGEISGDTLMVDHLQEITVARESIKSFEHSTQQRDKDQYDYTFSYDTYLFDNELSKLANDEIKKATNFSGSCRVLLRNEKYEIRNKIDLFYLEPTSEPRVYKLKSVYTKIPDPLCFIAFAEDVVLRLKVRPETVWIKHPVENAPRDAENIRFPIQKELVKEATTEAFEMIIKLKIIISNHRIHSIAGSARSG